MAYPGDQGGYPTPRDLQESQYPPPPGEEEDRARGAYHNRGPSGGSALTLPSISGYDQPYQLAHGYPVDPRGYQSQPYRAPPGQYDERTYQQDYGRGAPPQNMAFTQSAPRQRTAIACRYCRRRKIRCSGFEQSPEGRCTNCQRFQQDCIFTPVSAQAQAFVPAHAVYPGMRNMGVGPDGRPRPMVYPQGTQLFGAHGQPLGPAPPPPPPQQNSPYEYPAPSPTESYRSFTDERGSQPPQESRKRPLQDPHPSILPPPIPGQPLYTRADSAGRRSAADDELRLPPVTPTAPSAGNHSPGSSSSSQSSLQPPAQSGLVSLTRTTPPRSSPKGGEGSRSDPMSLGNIMERRPDTEIDRGMLGRLDRKAK